MPNFSQISRRKITSASTSEFILYDFPLDDGETFPVIRGRPATEANKPYFNSHMKGFTKTLEKVKRGATTVADVQKLRQRDRELFPKFVIVGWENVVEQDGSPVQFSQANCAELLEALPDDVFDDMRDHFRNPANFVPDDAPTLSLVEAEEAGNS